MTRTTQAREPHGGARKSDLMKEDRGACDHRRHSTQAADEKIEWNLPRPYRRLDHRLTVVTRLARNWAAGNVDTFAGNDALLPRLLAQLFEPLFGCRIARPEKKAMATRVAMLV